jgi:hypothetical protein
MILMRSNPLLTINYIQLYINNRYINYEIEFLFLYSFYTVHPILSPHPIPTLGHWNWDSASILSSHEAPFRSK